MAELSGMSSGKNLLIHAVSSHLTWCHSTCDFAVKRFDHLIRLPRNWIAICRTIPLGGALVQEPYSIGGSGSTYITGYCDSNFKKNMTKDECVKFVTTGRRLCHIVCVGAVVDVCSGDSVLFCSYLARNVTRWQLWRCHSPGHH